MRREFQKELIQEIKQKINGTDSIGNVLAEVLNISQDAAYRRFRCETSFTIDELERLCTTFSISLDRFFEIDSNRLLFDIQFSDEIDYSMDQYLGKILLNLQSLKAQEEPRLTFSVNNTPFFQLLNFPHLVRFKLFFWAKTHMQVEEYKNKRFGQDKISDETFDTGKKILQAYNSIPSRELVDPDLLRGFIREIYYYFSANHFEDPSYAFFLLEQLEKFIAHLQDQAAVGKKYIFGTQPPFQGNDFELYYNEILNAQTVMHYSNQAANGVYLAQNFMNFMHTREAKYVEDTLEVLNKQIANSSLISVVNEKERNQFFRSVTQTIQQYRKRMEVELEDLL